MLKADVIIIGAGAAGLMCAIEAAKRGRRVTVIEHANKPGKKIIMSGGGRCNFTNYHAGPDNYISTNPHFCKSALKQYTQYDFISLVQKYKISYYEKTLGQLFCTNKSRDIVDLLLSECEKYGVEIKLNTSIETIVQLKNNAFKIHTKGIEWHCASLVVACGGLSIPTMGASPFGYKIAAQFGLKVLPTRAGLVPFTLNDKQKEKYGALSGVAVDSIVTCNNISFREGLLFTHRGISGPSILQISSYWNLGDMLSINLLPDLYLPEFMFEQKKDNPEKKLITVLSQFLSKNIIKVFLETHPQDLLARSMKQLDHGDIDYISETLGNWQIKPCGTEGYRTAEVTLGGVDVNQISSKTMEANDIKGLYFIGEVLDVTGWLGGYNFQWAWSSGWVAGQHV